MKNKKFDLLMSLAGITNDDKVVANSATKEDKNTQSDEGSEYDLPILPIRNTVLFPNVVIPITVGRQKSVKLIKKANKTNILIGVVAQKDPQIDEPSLSDLYSIGTMARVLKIIVMPDGNTTAIIQGIEKIKIEALISENPYITAKVSVIKDTFITENKKETKALMQSLKESAMRILSLNPDIPREAQFALENIDNPTFLTHFLSSNINVELKEKQELLEINDGKERATRLLSHMFKEIKVLELKNEINSKVNFDLNQQQRDYFLRQQMKVLQDELGMETSDLDIDNLRKRGQEKKWTDKVKQYYFKELDKLARLNPAAPEYGNLLSYCEVLVDLPWGEYTEDNFDLKHAQEILDKEHYGLEKVKERIIEYLAVLKLKNDIKGPILCLYGPPGVGKTSLGRSIAKALNRKYVKMSLGGLHDESEIRGHRKTYIGAMPGKIIYNIKKAGTSNPVFVLDEIDKIGTDFRGDPSSALLEVLDPEQNFAFTDNYIEIDYDLSKVLFIATANSLDTIQPALRDRMEIIEVTGYTLEEKLEIAKKHLVPKQRKEHGLAAKDFSIDNNALIKIIDGYTRESGVRNLERKIGSVIRKIAKSVAMEEEYQKKITPELVEKMLGAPTFERESYQDNETAGVVTGLAWTAVGGDILFIESSLSKGKGKLTLSGQLGEVMKESAMAALSYLKANYKQLGIDYRIFDRYDLHIHVPAGAVPKDGPSAGITMLTSMASVFTQRKVKARLAMTGEITLRGKVLPIGGVKEKLLAAKRAGIKEVIFCKKNKSDVDEIASKYIDGLTLHYVDTAEEVLAIALTKELVTNAVEFELENKHEEVQVR
jgi:ATP-dependent Lon protease